MFKSLFKKVIILIQITIFLVIVNIFGCSHNKTGNNIPTNYIQDPKYYSKTLYIYSQATEIKYSNEHGTDCVEYLARVDYPAFTFLSKLSTHLYALEYTPVVKTHLSSANKITDINGWYEVHDVTKRPYKQMLMWDSYWESKDKSVVYAVLTYEKPDEQNVNFKILKVHLEYYPVDLAKDLKL